MKIGMKKISSGNHLLRLFGQTTKVKFHSESSFFRDETNYALRKSGFDVGMKTLNLLQNFEHSNFGHFYFQAICLTSQSVLI